MRVKHQLKRILPVNLVIVKSGYWDSTIFLKHENVLVVRLVVNISKYNFNVVFIEVVLQFLWS